MNLMNAEIGREYPVRAMHTGDKELEQFLFTLGCYPDQPITVVSRKKRSCVVAIKDGRYAIDAQLAAAIEV